MTTMTAGRDDIFVGREREMAQLTAVLDDAIAGHGRLVMLVGEPGIGKTRTAEELAAIARQRGAEVLWGHCPEKRGAPPYWPWLKAASESGRLPAGKALAVNCALAITAVIRRDPSGADSLLSSLDTASGVVVGSGEFGVVHVAVARIRGLLAALLGQPARARAEFDQAMSFCQTAGYLPELAWSCHDYADMLLRSDRSSPVATKVKALIDEGQLVAEKADMKPLVSRFGLLRERLARWRGGRQEYPDGLTERQAEVLRLIAGGKTNSEIAKELVLSERMVQRHVADIYAKIRARNRAEATAYALKEPGSLAGPPR